jgi:hypothetical protein
VLDRGLDPVDRERVVPLADLLPDADRHQDEQRQVARRREAELPGDAGGDTEQCHPLVDEDTDHRPEQGEEEVRDDDERGVHHDQEGRDEVTGQHREGVSRAHTPVPAREG